MSQKAEALSEPRIAVEEGVAGRIGALCEPVLAGLGFRLVRVRVSGRDGGTLQIMAERADGTLTIDDCAEISRVLGAVLDVEDPMPGHYHLEVSSPGIDRPLVRRSDFGAWAGHEAKIGMRELIDGRRRFRGRLEGLEGDEIRLWVDLDGYDEPQLIGLELGLVEEARLVMTDALVKSSVKTGRRKTGET